MPVPRALWWSWGGAFLMSEIPLLVVYSLGLRDAGLGSRGYHFFYRARGARAHE